MHCELLVWAVAGTLCGYALGQVLVLVTILSIERHQNKQYLKARK